MASYTVGLAVMGNIGMWSLGGALRATLFGAVSGGATYGIGSIFTAATQTFGNALLQAGAHSVSQGVLSMMQGQNFLSSVVGGLVGSLAASGWGAMMRGVGLGQFSESVYGMVTFSALSGGIGAELAGGNFWQGAVAGGIVAGLNHAMHKLVGPGDDELIKKLTPEQRKKLESIKSGTKLTKESLEILKLDKILDNWIEKTALGKNLKVGVLDYLEMGGEIYYDYNLSNYGAITKSEFSFRFVTTSSKGLIAGHFGNLAGGYVGSQYGAIVGGLAGAATGWALGIYIENTYVSGARFFINYMINFGNNLRNQATFNIINAGR